MWGLSALSKLPGMIAGGVKKGIGSLGQMMQDDPNSGMAPVPATPGINPGTLSASPSPTGFLRGILSDKPKIGVAGAPPAPERNLAPRPALLPEPAAQPTIEPIRDSVTIVDRVPSGTVQSPDVAIQGGIASRRLPPLPGRPIEPVGNPLAIQGPQVSFPGITTESRRDVPVPRLPGETGDPLQYTPERAARYDFVMKSRRGDDGGVTHQDENGNWVDNKERRNWKDILKSTGIGTVQGALANPNDRLAGAVGGAAAGGAASAISPQAGREMQFDFWHSPNFKEQEAEDNARADRTRKVEGEELGNRASRARVEQIEQETKLYPEKLKTEQMYRDAQRKQAEAAIARANRPPQERARQIFTDEDGNIRDRQTGAVITDPQTGRPIRGQQRRDVMMTTGEAEAERFRQEGSIASIAESSYKAREPQLVRQLPQNYQAALADPNNADPDLVKEAQGALNQLKTRERQRILQETREQGRVNADEIRRGSSRGRSGGGSGRINVNDASRRYPDLDFAQ